MEPFEKILFAPRGAKMASFETIVTIDPRGALDCFSRLLPVILEPETEAYGVGYARGSRQPRAAHPEDGHP
jgi:hypothetical protein